MSKNTTKKDIKKWFDDKALVYYLWYNGVGWEIKGGIINDISRLYDICIPGIVYIKEKELLVSWSRRVYYHNVFLDKKKAFEKIIECNKKLLDRHEKDMIDIYKKLINNIQGQSLYYIHEPLEVKLPIIRKRRVSK